MDIQKLTAKFAIRKLHEADIEDVLEVMQGNPLYFQHCPPMATRQSISEDMNALPPGTAYEDKYYIGYFKDGILIAVMDLILNYPNKKTAFIGFFMMNKDFQGKGNGTEIFRECCAALREEGYRYIRLGFAKGNPQSEAFWTKNGFERTGVEDVQERYTVVVLQKELTIQMLTLKEYFKEVEHLEEGTLVELSDKLWGLGTLEKIKEEVSPELFTLHIGMNMIGNWKGEGWWGVVSDHPELVPFIPDTLEAFGLAALKTAFEKVISCFPKDTVFSNDGNYCDTINFLQNARFKVANEKLNAISLEERKKMIKNIQQCLEELEQLTEPVWGYSAQKDGWKAVLDFIAAHK